MTPLTFSQGYAFNNTSLWGHIHWQENPTPEFDLWERECGLILKAINNCSDDLLDFSYELRLDIDNNGVPDTYINSNTPPPNGIIPLYNMLDGVGIPQLFDNRPVDSNQKWGFALSVQPTGLFGDYQFAKVIWKDELGQQMHPHLPDGNHEIVWHVKNICGDSTQCTVPFTVYTPYSDIDTIAPEISCINGLILNQLNASQNTAILWASDFVAEAHDSQTPNGLLTIGIRKSGTGAGFPMINGEAQTAVFYNCLDLGLNIVEVWVRDTAGNASFCESWVLIQDNTSICNTPSMASSYYGRLKTENNIGVEGAHIDFEGALVGVPAFSYLASSNEFGVFTFPNLGFVSAHFQVTPQLNTDILNGINTWDLVLISKHILGVQPLNGPYKLIAADANKSGTVTTFDIVELRKLLLGTYTNLPQNSSWRFVDKNQVFSNLENPFADSLRESLPAILNSSLNPFDFVGIKIGDVDNTAIPNNLLAPDDRDAPFTAFHITRNDAKHWLVNKGETVELTFANPTTLSGYQMTLETDGIQPSEVVPEEGMSSDNFGVFDHAVTTVFEQGNAPFSIRFTAEESGDLRDMIQVSSRITPAMAFGQNGEKMQVNLRFEGEKSNISPNPWSGHTRISFHTSEATTATLKVFDLAGRLVYFTVNNVEKGEQSFELNSAQVSGTGIMLYEITTDNSVISGKMHKQ